MARLALIALLFSLSAVAQPPAIIDKSSGTAYVGTLGVNVQAYPMLGQESNGTLIPLQLDSNGNLLISINGPITIGTVNQGLGGASPWLVTGTVASTQSGPWSVGRTWALSNSTDSIAAVQSGTWTVMQGAAPWSVSQSGVWTTGRTWTLSSGTDSVNIGNFPATQAVTQSGTWTVQQGSAPWSVSQSGTWNINNVSGTISLPTGAATAANQATANTSLASIDSKLTAPLSVTPTVSSNPWFQSGRIATASTATVQVSTTSFSYQSVNTTPAIQSSSANDTLAGTGCQKLTYTYFKADGSGPFTATDNMQGTTIFFSSSGANVSFVEYAYCSQVGSGGTNDGTVLMSDLSPLATFAAIVPGDSEVLNAHHIVPLGKTAYLTKLWFGSNTSTTVGRSANFQIKKQKIPLASNPSLGVTGFQKWSGTDSRSFAGIDDPIVVVGPAVITCAVTPFSSTADTWSCGIGGYEK